MKHNRQDAEEEEKLRRRLVCWASVYKYILSSFVYGLNVFMFRFQIELIKCISTLEVLNVIDFGFKFTYNDIILRLLCGTLQ
jgi:hypothetical protein